MSHSHILEEVHTHADDMMPLAGETWMLSDMTQKYGSIRAFIYSPAATFPRGLC